MLKRFLSLFLISIMSISLSFSAFAHSGRTDSNGGHRDNKNKSGLGSYHYHCGGYPAHLHTNGVCPYNTTASQTTAQSVQKVDERADNVYLNSVKYDMTAGETFTPVVVSNSSEATKYSSSNPSVASINQNTGFITALSPGTTTITAYNSKKNASYTLTVAKAKEYILYSNIKAEINNTYIPSYNYNGRTYIKCSDLNNYGFDVSYSKQSGIISVKRNASKKTVPISAADKPHGSQAFELLDSSLKVYDETNSQLGSINGGGYMFVLFSDLDSFGEISWNPQERISSLSLK